MKSAQPCIIPPGWLRKAVAVSRPARAMFLAINNDGIREQ